MNFFEIKRKIFKALVIAGFITILMGIYFLIEVLIFILESKGVKIPYVILGILLVIVGNFLRLFGSHLLKKINT